MSHGEVVISERSFYGYRFFYGVIEDTNASFWFALFLYQVFLVFIVIYLLFIVFETVQIVQLSCILWYKSNTSYEEVQVLTVVKGQAHIFFYRKRCS